MTDIADLIKDPRGRDEQDPNLLRAVVATTPVDATETVFVVIPSFDDVHRFGPCTYTPKILDPANYAIPEAGDSALVALNEKGEPVVVDFWETP